MNATVEIIQFNLSGPICSCEKQTLQWIMGHGLAGRADKTFVAKIECTACKVFIIIPEVEIRARFVLENKYPADLDLEKKKVDVKSIEGEIKEENIISIDFSKKRK